MNVRVPTLMAAALLSACVSQPRREPLPPAQTAAAEARQVAREAALRLDPAWMLQGRIAVSNGRNGGSGRVDWTQRGPRYDVSLSAPITRQSWRLVGESSVGESSKTRLEGLDGGTREGPDATALLRDATGWEIPVTSLAYWVRGMRAPNGLATVSYAFDGQLLRMEQGGWTIDYHWPAPDADARAAGSALAAVPSLPTRIDARRSEASVRLIIDQWADGAQGQ